MKALILAGGHGTRMGDVSQKIPKPMLKIGDAPILEHQIKLLKRYGIKEVTILSYHLAEMIERYFGDGSSFGIKIDCVVERAPLGTAGAVKEIENSLSEDFLVFYGDVMLDIDLAELFNFHKAKNSACTLVVHPNDHPQDSDLLEIDGEQRIVAFHPKPHQKSQYFRNMVNACVYCMSPTFLRYLPKGIKTDFGKDIFPQVIAMEAVYGYQTAEYLKDVGTLERLREVRIDYQNGRIGRFHRKHKRKAIFMDRDGVIVEKVHLIHKLEDLRLLPDTSQAIKKINGSDFLAVVLTNQPVIARNLCSLENLEEIHAKMETLLGAGGAKLDAIYYCPHHPDSGYPGENPMYKIDCDCRKPKVGLVKRAEQDLNIDLANSFLIGDSSRDALCAKNAGLVSILVNVGDDSNVYDIRPDYVFDDLNQAVDFIISRGYYKSL